VDCNDITSEGNSNNNSDEGKNDGNSDGNNNNNSPHQHDIISDDDGNNNNNSPHQHDIISDDEATEVEIQNNNDDKITGVVIQENDEITGVAIQENDEVTGVAIQNTATNNEGETARDGPDNNINMQNIEIAMQLNAANLQDVAIRNNIIVETWGDGNTHG